MDEQICPRCRTSKYGNPTLVLMVNECGHTLCENCVILLFPNGAGNCVECNAPLRRRYFRVQHFEDPKIEKEVDVRKKILKDYNKNEEDFASLDEYNNYLEEIENIVYKLTNNIDVQNTMKQVEQYKKENKDLIQKNRHKIGKEEQQLNQLIDVEKRDQDNLKIRYSTLEKDKLTNKIKKKEAFLDALVSSSLDTSNLIETYAQTEKIEIAKLEEEVNQFSTGIKFGTSNFREFLNVPKADNDPVYAHNPVILHINGPNFPPDEDTPAAIRKLNIRLDDSIEKTAGYTFTMSYQRALHDAYIGLFNVNELSTA